MEWIPIRWPCGPLDEEHARDSPTVRRALAAWLNPQALAFLKGGPVNAIVVTWAAGSPNDSAQQKALQPLLAEAQKLGIAVIGRVTGKVTDINLTGLSATIADNPVAGNLKSISARKAADASSATGAGIAISDASWPRIPSQWKTALANGPREPKQALLDRRGWKPMVGAARLRPRKLQGKTFG